MDFKQYVVQLMPVVSSAGAATVLALAFATTTSVRAQCELSQTIKLLGDDVEVGDHFGKSVSLFESTAIIGAPGFGPAFVFERIDDKWVHTGSLIQDDGEFQGGFGRSVEISGSTVVIGASQHDFNGEYSGAAYIFERVDGRWMQIAKLLADDGAAGDHFGYWVSVSDDTAVIAAPGDDNANGGNAGAAYVFEKIGGTWQQVAKLVGDDVETNDGYAQSASISGDTIVVSAPSDYVGGQRLGSVYVFEKVAGVWQQTAKLNADDAQDSDWFGGSVSIDGSTIVIGALGDDDNGTQSGSAYIFEKVDGTWHQMAKLLADDGQQEGYRFGHAASISGNKVVIGIGYGFDGRPEAAYVFEKVDGNWVQSVKLTTGEGNDEDSMGESISIWGDTVLAGAHDDDDNGNNAGAAFIFDLNCTRGSCPWDLDGNAVVGVSDLLSLLGSWGPCPPKEDCPADFDTSGDVGVKDLLFLLGNWGPCP